MAPSIPNTNAVDMDVYLSILAQTGASRDCLHLANHGMLKASPGG